MAKLESAIEGETARRALALGVDSIHVKAAGQSHYPDRLFFIPGGLPMFIEFKRPGQTVEPAQRRNHHLLRLRGYHVEVHDNVEEALQAIRTKVDAGALHAKGCKIPLGASACGPVP